MNYSLFGSSDLRISEIGLGCMSLSTNEKDAVNLIHRAVAMGVNFLDTADIYNDGVNETIVGKAIKDNRSNIILASKAGNVRRPDGKLDWNPSKAHILACIEGSLKRLQTDYLDLYQLHGGTISDNIDESIEAFELLKQQGKIRHYGISSIRPNVIREYVKRSSIVSVMMQFSLLDRRPEEECLGLLHQNNIGVLARGSVAQGLLVDKPAKPYLDVSEQQVKDAAAAIHSISTQRTPAQTALKYVLQNEAVAAAVVGIRTEEQLEDAVNTSSAPAISGEDLAMLRNTVPAIRYKDHRN